MKKLNNNGNRNRNRNRNHVSMQSMTSMKKLSNSNTHMK